MIKCSEQENILLDGTIPEIKNDFLNIVHAIEKNFDIDCEKLIKLYRKEQQKSRTKEEIIEEILQMIKW